MADPVLDEINSITHFHLYPKTVRDNFFKNAPFPAHLRSKCMSPFPGGTDMRFTFLYAPLVSGAYAQGENFNITKPQTYTSATFLPKFYFANVTEYLEQILVINRGPNSAFSQIDIDLKNAMNTISAVVGIDFARDGITSGRTKHMNGWTEALNDGVNPSYDGNVYTTYGGQTRNGAISDTLNSVPLWGGNSNGTAAPISYSILETAYQTASRGPESPDLGVTNKLVYAGIKQRIQPQQRFAQERDPYFGASGFKINDAMVLKDDYFPSARFGVNDARIGNYSTTNFTSTAATTTASGIPASTALTVGDVFCWFNTRTWTVYVAEHPLYGFGFTGFKHGWDHTRVAGQVLAMINLQCQAPWGNIQIFGLNG